MLKESTALNLALSLESGTHLKYQSTVVLTYTHVACVHMI